MQATDKCIGALLLSCIGSGWHGMEHRLEGFVSHVVDQVGEPDRYLIQ